MFSIFFNSVLLTCSWLTTGFARLFSQSLRHGQFPRCEQTPLRWDLPTDYSMSVELPRHRH